MSKIDLPKKTMWKAAALAAGLGLAMLSSPVHAVPTSGGDTVQGLYEALLATMKNGRTLGQSGRFTQTRAGHSPEFRYRLDGAPVGRSVLGIAE